MMVPSLNEELDTLNLSDGVLIGRKLEATPELNRRHPSAGRVRRSTVLWRLHKGQD
jgi:hypothetical protein